MTEPIVHTLIEASAGTGKTQALAERLIALLEGGLRPSEIVALTFSRAAAGEIFERFVTLLAKRAETSSRHAKLLREVIATQHLSQIGTLDSFLMRIVRAFPAELGLDGEIEMMDDYRAGEERSRVSFSILRRTDRALKRNFVDAFALALNREDARSFVDSYRKFITEWHERVEALPDDSAWGMPEAIWGDVPAFAKVTEKELAAAADSIAGICDAKAWPEFLDWMRSFRGSFSGVKGIAKKLLELDGLFASEAIVFSFNRKEYTIFGEDAKKLQTAMMCVFGYVLRMKLELARGVKKLISAFECEYDRRVRREGRLVFADIPRLIASLDEVDRLDIEYRMDSRIRAWALDEFQDTSREQWKSIANLIDEAKQSDGSTPLFIVGDTKQAIYGWRNGDVGIFRRERDAVDGNGAPMYVKKELVKSYRFGPAITEAVNRVFAFGRVGELFPTWECPEHKSERAEPVGFVQRIDAPGAGKDAFIEPVYNALKAVDPVGRRISAAVLVRQNDLGETMAEGLRALGLEGVVWEGESSVLDTPALSGFLDLVQLADHPGDMLTYRHFALTPVAKAMYPDGVPEAAEISRAMSAAFTERGLVRVFRELRAKLPCEPEKAWSRFTEDRFTDMLRAAAEFELSLEPGTRLADFQRFLASKEKRELAEPGRIKVMTIHRSKGLGFDYVVLPVYEHEGLGREPKTPLITDRWILPSVDQRVVRAVPGLKDAWQERKDRAEQEELCMYYVAMTRAKQAMTLVLHPHPATSDAIRFSDLVREAMPEEIGDREWHLHLRAGVKSSVKAPSETGNALPPVKRGRRQHIARRLPSKGFVAGQSAGSLFSPFNARKAAMERGTKIHAEFEKVDFNDWIKRPEGFTELWRERPFEVFLDGVWMSGRFDRVVFCGRKAVIQDFKTGRRVDPCAYEGQMRSYRKALSLLTGIPEPDIRCELLLTATHETIPCEL